MKGGGKMLNILRKYFHRVSDTGKTEVIKVIKVIDKIKYGLCPTHEEIELILNNKQISVPLLCEILREVIGWKEIPEERTDAHCHAVFLLGALESKEGLKLLKKILSRDLDFVEGLFGDIITECLHWPLSRMSRDNPSELYKIARDNSLYWTIRSAAVRAGVEQCFIYPERRKKFVEYFRKLLKSSEKDPEADWPTTLVSGISTMAPNELREEITELFDKDLIALGRIDREGMEESYQKPSFYYMTVDDDIFSIYDSYGWMIAWNDPVVKEKREENKEEKDSYSLEPIRREHKTGRNEPCICGSGKKYKKCCGV